MNQLRLKSELINDTKPLLPSTSQANAPRASHVSHIRKWNWDYGYFGASTYHTGFSRKCDIVLEIYLTNFKDHNIRSIRIYANNMCIYEVPFIFFKMYAHLNNGFASKFKFGYIPLLLEKFFGHKFYMCALAFTEMKINVETDGIQPLGPAANFYIEDSEMGLPPEMWYHLMTFCDTPTWGNMRRTCKLLYCLPADHVIQDRFNMKMSTSIPTLKAKEVLLRDETRHILGKQLIDVPISTIMYRKIVLENNQPLEISYLDWRYIKFLIVWVKSKTGQKVSNRKIESIKLLINGAVYFDHTGWELNVLLPLESSILKDYGITGITDSNIYIYPFIDKPHSRGLNLYSIKDPQLIINFNQYIDPQHDIMHVFTVNDNVVRYFSGLVGFLYL